MMAAYRKEFDERMPALETAIRDMPGNLGDIVPGFSRERLLRLFKRLSILLGRLDSKGAKHPQYLWNEGVLAPASLIGQVDSVIANMASGAASFVQNNLPGLLKINDALEKAIGTDATEAKALASSVSTDLSIAVAQTDELQSKAERNVQVLGAIEKSAQAAQASIAVSLDQVKGDAERAATARRELEAMVNPDGRRKDSLETLARKARERIAEIETIFLAGSERLLEADKSANHAKSQQTEAELILTSLRSAKNEAEQVLHLSSQAGLASSYQRESERLQKRSTFFTGILYFSSAVTILLAAFYVLPELNKALSSSNDGIGFWQALSFTLLRV